MNAPTGRPLAQRYAHLGTGPISVEPVASPEYFALERASIFKRSWLIIGREDDLPNPGDYLVKDIETLQTSLIIARGEDGKIHAFHNMCSHRGMAVCPAGFHSGKRLNCPFHGWSYDLQGKLVGVPDEDQFYDLDRKSLGLTGVQSEVWEGFIFINVDPRPTESLKDFLGELYGGYLGYFDTMHKVDTYTADLRMNWKLYVDSSIEAYHANVVHEQNNTGQNQKTSGIRLYLNPSSVRLYKRHRSIGVPAGVGQREYSPTETLAYKYGAMTPYDARQEGRLLPPGINVDKDPHWAFDILEIFPNTILFLSAPMYVALYVWPSAVDQCKLEAEIYTPLPQNAAERVSLEYALVSLREVVREDLNTAAGIQRRVRSGAVRQFHFSDQEIAVRHNYKVVDEYVSAYRAAVAK